MLGLVFFGLIFLTAIIPFSSYSQSLFNTEDFFIKTSPESPGPDTEVAAEVVSFNFDVNRAYITWILNGKTGLKGKGEKGRIVIPQYLPMTKELRRLYINMDEDEDKYLQEGRKAGLLTFPELGMLYAISGFISLDEMKRSIADEEDIFTERDNMVNMIKKWQHHKDWYTSDHNPFIKV